MTYVASDEESIRVENLGKCYQIYDKPVHRLQQFLMPRLDRLRARRERSYFREFWAIRDLGFSVRRGEVVGIVGRNGSGKSTLLQIICGVLAPTTGRVETRGRVAALLELGSGFNAEFTGRENVYTNGLLLGLGEEEIDARFDEIAAFADIGDFLEQPVKTYSSGMLMRLAFAVSVCVDPDILVIDEALAVGDAGFQFKCMERMKRLTASGTTLLFVSHDMGMVKSFCHQVIYLEHGREKMRGQPDAVAEQYFLDLRDEQRRHVGAGMPVFRKKSLGDSGLAAFGTENGHIVDAGFLPDGGAKTVVGVGERIRLRIAAEYRSDLPHPALSVILMDRRMLDLGGRSFPLQADSETDGMCHAAVEAELDVRLRSGPYFLTLRLESRAEGNQFLVVDKQPAALSFEVAPHIPDFLGILDIGLCRSSAPRPPSPRPGPRLRVVALLAVRNEALYLRRCLDHLRQQGIDTCVIDNDSTDDSLAIARSYLGRGIMRIERQPYVGHFDLLEQLRLKEQLAAEIDADWFIHQDADEIREAPEGYASLHAALVVADRLGYNAANFEEFVFCPLEGEAELDGPFDYVRRHRHYYFFAPAPLRRVTAWKRQPAPVDLRSMAGHRVLFPDCRIFPDNLILRHYIALSKAHLLRKYGAERVYAPKEIEEQRWHGPRASFDPQRARLPRADEVKNLDVDGWDRSAALARHPIFGV